MKKVYIVIIFLFAGAYICPAQQGQRLEALKKVFIKEYRIALDVINKISEEENAQLKIELEDAFRDEINKTNTRWTLCMNQVQGILVRYL